MTELHLPENRPMEILTQQMFVNAQAAKEVPDIDAPRPCPVEPLHKSLPQNEDNDKEKNEINATYKPGEVRVKTIKNYLDVFRIYRVEIRNNNGEIKQKLKVARVKYK